jgi:hypothetical protein
MPKKVAGKMRNRDKLVERSSMPIPLMMGLCFMEAANRRTQQATIHRKKNFSTFQAAANEGLSLNTLHNIAEHSCRDAMRSMASVQVIDEAEGFLQTNLMTSYLDRAGVGI